MEDPNPNYTALTKIYSADIAEALHERGVTVDEAHHLSATELLDHYLEWNGIIGWTESIMHVLDTAREVVGRR